jgi:hypothetical protein
VVILENALGIRLTLWTRMMSRLVFGFTMWWTDDEPARLLLWLGLKALHIALCSHSLCGLLGWSLLVVYGYPVCDPAVIRSQAKEMPLCSLLRPSCFSESGVPYAANVSQGVSYYWAKKTYHGRSNSSRILVVQFIPCSSWHFSVKMAILWETKIVPRE